MTYRELLRDAERRLKNVQIEEAAYDAKALLLHCFQMNMTDYLMRADQACEDEEGVQQFAELVKRREAHEPLQYILKEAWFCGHPFYVAPGVLIPRYDTETLVDLVLSREKNRADSVLDVCTGSGCIGLSLFLEGEYSLVQALDISDQALAIARKNAETLVGPEQKEEASFTYQSGFRTFSIIKSDLFASVKEKVFDVIVSNPPYIRSEEIETLSQEVKRFEPKLALDGEQDGLSFYRKIVDQAPDYLKPGGRLYFEIGADQSKEVEALLQKKGYTEIATKKDLAGLDRVVMAQWRKVE